MTDSDDKRVARFCPYCERPFTGENGILSHLEQVAGQENHPEDIAETHAADDFPRVKLTEQGNIRRVLDETGDIGTVDADNPAAVPVRRVYRLIAERIADHDRLTAHRARKQLLGAEPPDRPVRDLIHPDVYRALLEHGDEGVDQQLSATLQPDMIQVTVGDEMGDYSADEALDLAASLEPLAEGEDGDEELEDFIAFLRHAAAVLEEGDGDRDLHEEFHDWRGE